MGSLWEDSRTGDMRQGMRAGALYPRSGKAFSEKLAFELRPDDERRNHVWGDLTEAHSKQREQPRTGPKIGMRTGKQTGVCAAQGAQDSGRS